MKFASSARFLRFYPFLFGVLGIYLKVIFLPIFTQSNFILFSSPGAPLELRIKGSSVFLRSTRSGPVHSSPASHSISLCHTPLLSHSVCALSLTCNACSSVAGDFRLRSRRSPIIYPRFRRRSVRLL